MLEAHALTHAARCGSASGLSSPSGHAEPLEGRDLRDEGDAESVISTRRPRGAPDGSDLVRESTRPSVRVGSVGRPSMVQRSVPSASNASFWHARGSAPRQVLLITFRRRWVPASGAMGSRLPHASPVSQLLYHGRVHGRQRDRDPLRLEAIHQVEEQRLDRAVLSGVQRRERELVVAGRADRAHDRVAHLVRIPLSGRPVDVARLAEAAADRTSAHQLDRDPVVHDLSVRHDDPIGEGKAVEVHDDPPLHGKRGVGSRHRDQEPVRGGSSSRAGARDGT